MLSAYETGKHRPSLDTTERVLAAMGCDVIDLTNALQAVLIAQKASDEQEGKDGSGSKATPEQFTVMVPETLGVSRLVADEKEVLNLLLPGMLGLIRYLKR